MKLSLFFTGVFLLGCSCRALAQEQPIALVGATIIDVANYGNDSADISNSVVLFRHGKIIAAGPKARIAVPKNALIVHAEGKYIIPGLIDCFSVIGSQGQANSHLYYGVTTIVAGPGDDRRKGWFPNVNPSPHIKMLTIIPSDSLETALEKTWTLTPADIAKVDRQIGSIDSLYKAGIRTILLQHMFPEELLPKMEAKCEQYGINTIGEIQYARYTAGMKAGINSFVHTSRYILGALPDTVFIATRNQHDSLANVAYSNYMRKLDPETDPSFKAFSIALSQCHTALMPTLAMLYTSLPDHQNIW